MTLITWVFQAKPGRWEKILRIIWTLGFVLFVAHVLAAFHYHHRWSHASAIAETARQTRASIGFEFGAGIYFNHLFMIVWAIDLIWIWCASETTMHRYRWLRMTWIAYLIFIAFNGVAIFKDGWMRAGGIAALFIMLVGITLRWRSKQQVARLSPQGESS